MASAVICMFSLLRRSLLCCLSSPPLQPADQMIRYYTETENWRKCFFCGPHRVLSSVCCWLTARSSDILCRGVITLGQEPAGVGFAFPSSTFPPLLAIGLSPPAIPQSALNYWAWCAVPWDHGCSFLLSTSCTGEIIVIAEISEQNEIIIGFTSFWVWAADYRLPHVSQQKSGDGRLTSSEFYSHIHGIVTQRCWIFQAWMQAFLPSESSLIRFQFYLGGYWLACMSKSAVLS